MRVQAIDIKTQDGVADAYLARPDDQPRPAVLFIMDAFGLRPQIESMVGRIGAKGFVVLAPNIFYRAGPAPVLPLPDLMDPEQRGSYIKAVTPIIQSLTPDLIARDAASYLDLLEDIGQGPIAVTGYCVGGRVGWYIATTHPERVVALAAFHTGGLVTDADDSPHRRAGRLNARVYFGHADNDASMTPEHIATLEQALDQAGVTYRSDLYEGAAHGYTMADAAVYNELAAERHYTELFALLDRTIASPTAG
jgi:carboxymethylenebutenolidase